jgi:DGQHR domain-containing protein
MKIAIIKIVQPIGTFYISALNAEIVCRITTVERREYDNDNYTSMGIQRAISTKRVNEIAKYTNDPDATFPTPIIISVNDIESNNLGEDFFEFDENSIVGEIIDGQHRVEGLKKSDKRGEFTLPVILMFNLQEEDKAYVFSIINSKQTQVTKSLIYDLFSVSESRSPQKTCHELARLLNTDEESPFYRRLKMLGAKNYQEASLSQGSFIRYLMPLISKKPDEDYVDIKLKKALNDDSSIPLRYYFINNEDGVIYKILLNVFKALKDTFPNEWNNPDKFILSKTTGYGALIGALKILVKEGRENKDLTYDYFRNIFEDFKNRLEESNQKLTSEFFKSNEQEQNRLTKLILGR